MADSNIGALPQAAQLGDDSLLVAEQQGQAVKVTGAQFKEFGRQAVIGQVQDYVDQAQEAAEEAVSAVSAVTDMTVEATTLDSGQSATVTKTIKQGKVNLSFGLPRGEQGEKGPTGETGPRGPQGPAGKGLTILGYYDTPSALQAAVPAPAPGNAYGVGTAVPYDIYVFDGESGTWINNGPLSGGGGGPLPENVVTAEDGASMSFSLNFGDGPHVVSFDQEEELPLTAEDISYSDTQNVKQAIDGLKSSVSDGKALVASAITDKGVATQQDATFAQMAENIGQITTGDDTSDATANPGDILAGKTAYTAAGKVEGIIPTLAARTITPGTADQTIANGQYLGGTQTIKGDPNLTSANIKKGVTLFGVEGAVESTFQATLTVTADVGAVVTATHSSGGGVSALSTTGTVVLELPFEGEWSVTAQRGMAQYNTVTLQVTSSYNAELTAAVHVEYYTNSTLFSRRRYFAGTLAGDYAIFFGGDDSTTDGHKAFEAFDSNLSHVASSSIGDTRQYFAAASIGDYALFGGGSLRTNTSIDTVFACDQSLTTVDVPNLLHASRCLAAASVTGSYAVFGGGCESGNLEYVYGYDSALTIQAAPNLSIGRANLAAGGTGEHVLFGGGGNGVSSGGDSYNAVEAYDKYLTRTMPTPLSSRKKQHSATSAGNYVLFAGGNTAANEYPTTVDAYDMFLTRTNPEALSVGRERLAGTSVGGCAVFGGGRIAASNFTTTDAVDVYDPYLVHTKPGSLSKARCDLAACAVGNIALFAGGWPSDTMTAVDVYRYV